MNTNNPMKNDRFKSGVYALFKTLKLLLVFARITLGILLCLYVVSGVFTVKPNEQAFILRFGKPVTKNGDPVIYTPGNWYWAWPKPIDKITRIPVKRAKTIVSASFWRNEKGILLKDEQPSQGKHQALIPGIDGYLLTGDTNIFHCKWSISYQITDPIAYHANHGNPENAIQYALDSTILKIISTTPIEQALYQGAEELRLGVLDQAEARIDQMNLGITLTNISFLKKEPPQSMLSDFSAVIEAEQKRSQMITEAHGYAERVLQETIGNCTKIIASAEGYRNRIVSSVKADKEYYLKIIQEYKKTPETMLLTLHSNVMNEVLNNVDQKFIIHAATEGKKQEIRLLMDSARFSNKKNQSANPSSKF